MNEHFLSFLIFSPLLFAVVIAILPQKLSYSYKWLTLGASILQVLLFAMLLPSYKVEANGYSEISSYAFVEKFNWFNFQIGNLGQFKVEYFLGLDGLSISMVGLSIIVLLFASISSWNITNKSKGYFTLFLVLNTSILGCFIALDAFLFYVFFEFMLLPMFFLIGIWGGERREYASIKFFIYTLVGSILILIVFLGQYASVIDPLATARELGNVSVNEVYEILNSGKMSTSTVVHSFSMLDWANPKNYIPESILSPLLYDNLKWAFILLLIGFSIKLAIVPLHTWLPDAHVEAPTAGSVILAGVLLKVGGYGLIRMGYAVYPTVLPELSWWIGLFGMISIIYGSYNALAQSNLKKLIAYSSVAHMGFVLLGLASGTIEGINGAIYQMFAHGFISSMLFLLAGVLYDRTHNLEIENYRGIASKMPFYTAFTTIAFFASLGLPGFAGFIGEFMVFVGGFTSTFIPSWMTIVSLFGLILGAAYYLWTLQRIFFGKLWIKNNTTSVDTLKDLTSREFVLFIPLSLLIILFGVYPSLLLDYLTPMVQQLINLIH